MKGRGRDRRQQRPKKQWHKGSAAQQPSPGKAQQPKRQLHSGSAERQQRTFIAQPKGKPRREPGKIDLRAIARSAMQKYGFSPDFPAGAVRETEALRQKAGGRMEQGVRDLRHLPWSSIDNYDTEDLDQIECCEPGENGEIRVWVGVADVDAYVPKRSALDAHALSCTTSVYTGIQTFPMLPDRLSKNLSSLPEGQDRLAVVVEFTVLQSGVVRPGGIHRALVRNKAKLVYEQVAAWLEGTGPMPQRIAQVQGMEEQIFLQDKAAQRLERYRMARGALELESMEARAVIKDDKVLGLAVVQENRAMHIIENFMIGANGVMSGFLERSGVPSIHRVVREPKDWEGIRMLASGKGFSLPGRPSAKSLSLFLERQKRLEPEKFGDLSLAIVKLIGAGEYVMHDKNRPIGHFCLAVTHYTHGTAPNRRYVDLVIQRLIKAALARRPTPYTRNELSGIAVRCTEREMAAKRAERFMVKAEAATLLEGKVGQEFDAILTGMTEHGTYARLLEPPVEGRLVRMLRGARVGQKLRVRLVNLDPRRGFVDFEAAR